MRKIYCCLSEKKSFNLEFKKLSSAHDTVKLELVLEIISSLFENSLVSSDLLDDKMKIV